MYLERTTTIKKTSVLVKNSTSSSRIRIRLRRCKLVRNEPVGLHFHFDLGVIRVIKFDLCIILSVVNVLKKIGTFHNLGDISTYATSTYA